MFTGRLKTEVPISIAHFVTMLLDQPNLTTIDLSDNALGPIGAESLVKLFANTSITTIILRNNGLGIGGGKMIADALVEIPVPSRLRTIVIGRNRLESQGAGYLAKAFEIHTGLVC
jgi:Ran GTPase-activating protein 1